jgi:hypothetical protein
LLGISNSGSFERSSFVRIPARFKGGAICLALALAGCSGASTQPATATPPQALGPLQFVVTPLSLDAHSKILLSFFGQVTDPVGGGETVSISNANVTVETQWNRHPGDPIHPGDPVHPGDPIHVHVSDPDLTAIGTSSGLSYKAEGNFDQKFPDNPDHPGDPVAPISFGLTLRPQGHFHPGDPIKPFTVTLLIDLRFANDGTLLEGQGGSFATFNGGTNY